MSCWSGSGLVGERVPVAGDLAHDEMVARHGASSFERDVVSRPPCRRTSRRRRHPVHIPPRSQVRQRPIPRRSGRRSPEAPARTRRSPQDDRRKDLLTRGIPAYPRSGRKRHDRPVTPEVAGSSPVAPVENTLQIGIFCCRSRRNRPPASQPVMRSSRTRIPDAVRSRKALQIAIFPWQARARVFGHPAQIPQADDQFDRRGAARSLVVNVDLPARTTGASRETGSSCSSR
jgi:hypothetical protein